MKTGQISAFLNHVYKIRDFIYDILFPIECAGCGSEGKWLCSRCFRRLPVSRSQYCFACKKENDHGRFCRECGKGWHLDGLSIASDYDDELVKKMIRDCKYRFARSLAPVLGDYLALFFRDQASRQLISKEKIFSAILEKGLIISVPLHKKRLKWRGFNQSEDIACRLAANLGIQTGFGLAREKFSRPQSKLKEKERIKAVRGSFIWKGQNLKGRPVLLVDDVATTGSTINECAKVLKENGAGKIWGMAVAKG